MAPWDNDSLFTSGLGSNDPIPTSSRQGIDLGPSGRLRREADENLAVNATSHEVQQRSRRAEYERMIADQRWIREQESKIEVTEALEAALKRADAAMVKAREGDDRELRLIAKETGAWDKKRGYLIIDEKGEKHFLNQDEFERAIKSGNKRAEQLQRQLRARLAQTTRMRTSGGRASGGAVDEPGFHIGDVISALTTGNWGGIARELMQPIGGGRFGQGLGARGRMMMMSGAAANAAAMEGAEAAARTGGIGGFVKQAALGVGSGAAGTALAGGGRMAIGRLLALAPMLATPATLLAIQQGISRVTKASQDTVRAGQVTGGGFGEGLAARRETFQLAINPFDMLDRRTAGDIVKGIRGRGFSGELGAALQDTVGDVFQDLGTDIEQTMEMATAAVRTGSMSLSEFRDSMRDLDDVAKNANLSVKTVAEGFKTFVDAASAAGGPTAAREAALNLPALTEQFANFTGLVGPETAATVETEVLKRAAMMGIPGKRAAVPEYKAGSAQVQRDVALYYEEVKKRLRGIQRMLNPPTLEELARYLAGPGQGLGYAGGLTDVSQILAFLRDLFKGGDLETRFTGRKMASSVSAAKAAQKGSATTLGDMKFGFNTSLGDLADAGFHSLMGKLGRETISQESMKVSLSKLRQGLEQEGRTPEEIKETLKPLRQIAFQDVDDKFRSAEWKGAFKRVTEDLAPKRTLATTEGQGNTQQQEVKVVVEMRPEAARYFQTLDVPTQNYIYNGKNSQFTMRTPKVGP